MSLKDTLNKLHWLLSSQFGLNIRKFFRSLRGIPAYVRDWWRFRREYTGPLVLLPCLHDRYEEGGITKNEYFWQDLLVARWIFEASPEKHVDVGSRVDGFVTHVASFRKIEVFDVRPVSTVVPGVVFKRADFMGPVDTGLAENEYCDSLSCLHAIEHFGLGRYGDPLDPQGAERGIANMAQLLKARGRFYLSTPIGRERVEFNAHRVFDPRTIIGWAKSNELRLLKLTVISADGTVSEAEQTEANLQKLAVARYLLGIFVFEKENCIE